MMESRIRREIAKMVSRRKSRLVVIQGAVSGRFPLRRALLIQMYHGVLKKSRIRIRNKRVVRRS